MVRFIAKGGIWRNSEDEILKAAVMKYGLNQWSRISSLLTNKTSKQCKSRWYEWLDPNIKKIEWTNQENQLLLYYARTLPNQWKTIASLIGRTAQQCTDQLIKLTDIHNDAGSGVTNSNHTGTVSNVTDVIQLSRDIDPLPESKPAKPDSIDMDSIELEQLNEARARLANTKGKKAKRKIREQLLSQSKKLADLHKQRELLAAGININKHKKIKKQQYTTDYGTEIPFQQYAQPGLYDITDENKHSDQLTASMNQSILGATIQSIEGQSRDEMELAERKKDGLKKKLLNDSGLNNIIQQMNQSNHNKQSVHIDRHSLQLPSPTIESNNIHTINIHTVDNNVRTPQIQSNELNNAIQQLQATQNIQTPLHGGNNTPLVNYNNKQQFASTVAQTPNPLLTPARNNDVHNESVSTHRNNKKQKLQQLEQQIKSNFTRLPQPENEYELNLPDITHVDINNNDSRMKDGMPVDAEVQQLADEQQQKLLDEQQYEMRSTVYKHKLIQPNLTRSIHKQLMISDNLVEQMIYNEMIDLIHVENKYFNGNKQSKHKYIELLDYKIYKQAQQLIHDELQQSMNTIDNHQLLDYMYHNDDNNTTNDIFTSDELAQFAKQLVNKTTKYENNLAIKLGGYAKLIQSNKSQLNTKYNDITNESINLSLYSQMQYTEDNISSKSRLQYTEQLLSNQQVIHYELQQQYQQLMDQKNALIDAQT